MSVRFGISARLEGALRFKAGFDANAGQGKNNGIRTGALIEEKAALAKILRPPLTGTVSLRR
jgi:hypothetical protein